MIYCNPLPRLRKGFTRLYAIVLFLIFVPVLIWEFNGVSIIRTRSKAFVASAAVDLRAGNATLGV